MIRGKRSLQVQVWFSAPTLPVGRVRVNLQVHLCPALATTMVLAPSGNAHHTNFSVFVPFPVHLFSPERMMSFQCRISSRIWQIILLMGCMRHSCETFLLRLDTSLGHWQVPTSRLVGKPVGDPTRGSRSSVGTDP